VERAVAAQRVALAGALFSLTGSANASKQLLTNQNRDTTTATLVDAAGKTFGDPAFNFVGATYKSVTIPGVGTSPTSSVIGTGSLTISQPILALRPWHQIGTAKVNTAASKLSLEDVKRNLALNVANALVGVITAERVAEINRVGLQQALARLD